MKRLVAVALVIGSALSLSACSANDPLANQFKQGDNKNYIAGDDSVTEFSDLATRKTGAAWSSTTADGKTLSSSDLLGKVVVLNFWYAGCAPCRAETPELDKLAKKYASKGVVVVGVDLRDTAETALAFNRTHNIGYPSVMDNATGDVVLAYTGIVTPDAVPTTLVLDKQGRVASRVIGRIVPDILETLIKSEVNR
ncbi:MAG: TlpA disulfide reductase family protein [Rhodoluna sp.]|nr:TlpA disulfide reductase family protein [Rhodoluna sp.]